MTVALTSAQQDDLREWVADDAREALVDRAGFLHVTCGDRGAIRVAAICLWHTTRNRIDDPGRRSS